MSEAVATSQQGLVEKYQPYPEYKDSGVEWLGDVPTDWRVIKLGFLATKIGSGKTPSGGATVYVDDGITFLRSQNVYDDGLRLDDVVHITPDVDMEMAHSRVKPMDILLNITGASIGRTCIVPLGIGSANVNQHVCIIRLNKSEIVRFVSWAVKAQSNKAQIDNAQTGAAREGLNFEQIASLLLSLPPETECEQISDFLDYETARIDRLIAQQQRLIELLKEKRQAVISHAVTKGLNPNAPMKDSGVEWLGQIPDHWLSNRVGWCCQVGNGCTPSRDNMDYWSEGMYPWLNSGKVNDGYIISAEQFVTVTALKECSLPKVPAGSIVMAITGEGKTRGSVAITGIDTTLSQHLAFITVTSKKLSPMYLRIWLESQYQRIRFESEGGGSTKAAITCSDIKSYPLPEPPLNEQLKIVEYVGERGKTFDLLIQKSESMISVLQERRIALISAAVTGKIDLRGWTPPAEEVAA
ncbi:restriction endonuclease subunit S [Aeromonas dhakensis]|nr:restriction endonuclease subunit S [Aeromonas dhakensis]